MNRVERPTSNEQYRSLVAAIPTLSTVAEVQASPNQFAKIFKYLADTLPSRASDEESGRTKLTVYASILGHFSNDALAFMARRACETLDWFPTPKQCLEILREYPPPQTPRATAERYCFEYRQAQMEAFLNALRDGAATADILDGKPDQWLRIANERGYLRKMSDGSYIIRQKQIGSDG